MTTKTRGFPTLEADTTAEAYDYINQLINGVLPEGYILEDWIQINGVLYARWNAGSNTLTVAQKQSDTLNEHLWRHTLKRLQINVAGKSDPENISYDVEQGKVIGIKYAGSSPMDLAFFKVDR